MREDGVVGVGAPTLMRTRALRVASCREGVIFRMLFWLKGTVR